jgi:IS4 transposase
LCAYRKDRESGRQGLETIRKTNGRKHGGKEITKRQRAYNRYVVAATSLFGEGMSADRVMELYRLRWQIELAFKRLKTLFDCRELPTKLDAATCALFYGKLLPAAPCERITHGGHFSPRGGRKDGSG